MAIVALMNILIMAFLNKGSNMSDKINNLLENGYLKLGTVIVVVGALISFISLEIRYRTGLDNKIDRIEMNITLLRQVVWSDQDMMIWVLRAHKAGYDSLPEIRLNHETTDKLFPDR